MMPIIIKIIITTAVIVIIVSFQHIKCLIITLLINILLVYYKFVRYLRPLSIRPLSMPARSLKLPLFLSLTLDPLSMWWSPYLVLFSIAFFFVMHLSFLCCLFLFVFYCFLPSFLISLRITAIAILFISILTFLLNLLFPLFLLSTTIPMTVPNTKNNFPSSRVLAALTSHY